MEFFLDTSEWWLPIAGAVITQILAEATRFRPRIIYYEPLMPGQSRFTLTADPRAPLTVSTSILTVENPSWRTAHNIELVFSYQIPASFIETHPPRQVDIRPYQDGKQGMVLHLNSLGPGEHTVFNLVSLLGDPPQIQTVRFQDGRAKPVQIRLVPNLPQWVIRLMTWLMIFGTLTCCWLIASAIWQVLAR